MPLTRRNAPTDAQFVALATDAVLTNERVLTGTANQVTVTDGGAGAAVTLSLPQDIHTGASPTFASLRTTATAIFGEATLAPGASLHVVNTGAANTIAMYDKYNASGGHELRWRRARGTVGTPLALAANDVIGDLSFHGHDGVAFVSVGLIRVRNNATAWTNSPVHTPAFMAFSVTAGSTGVITERMRIAETGNVSIGIGATPTASLHIKAGTATANTAPLKFNSGTSLTTAEAGAVEFTTDDLFFTITTGAARKAFVLDDGARLTSGTYPKATTNGRLIDGPTPLAGTKVYYVADSSGGAVTRKLTFIDGVLTSET